MTFDTCACVYNNILLPFNTREIEGHVFPAVVFVYLSGVDETEVNPAHKHMFMGGA